MTTNSFINVLDLYFPMPETTETPIMSFIGIASEMKRGNIRVPDFQRQFIWNPDQVLELLDSVWHGYPIGSILLWETTETLNEHNPLKLHLDDLPKGTPRRYILDGQQRLVTLYEVLHDSLDIGKKRKIRYATYFDLKKKEFYIYKKSDIEVGKGEPKIETWFIPLNEVMTINYQTRSAAQNNKILEKLSTDHELLKTYVDLFIKLSSIQIPTIITSQNLTIACRIFERLNTSGTPLTIVDLMIAITYTEKFNLRKKFEDEISDLDTKDFYLTEKTILQCISACLEKETTRDSIIKSGKEIELKWKKTTESLMMAIDFLRNQCSVPVSKFLPYDVILAPLSYFFYQNGNKQLSSDTIKKLRRYFWFNVLSERYIQAQDTKTEEDIKEMDKLINDSKEKVFDYDVDDFTWDEIKEIEMSFGSSLAKSILCFLASKIPLEFKNNERVNLSSAFAEANLKELHHVFPRNFIKSQFGEDTKEYQNINSIANITLLSKTTNREIWDTKPSKYFGQFTKENKNLDIALKSHLIGNIDDFGISKDDFNKFLNKRAKLIEEELNQFIRSLK